MSQKEHGLQFNSIFSALSGVASILSFLGLSAVVIFNTVTKVWSENWRSIIFPGIAFVISLIVFIAFRAFGREIAIFLFNLFAQKNPYRLKCRIIEYEYISPTTMKYRTEYTVVAMQTGVDFVRSRINWTGETEGNPVKIQPILESGFYTSRIAPDGCEYGYNYYKIFSHTPINRGENIKLGAKIDDLVDKDKKAVPHLLTNVNVQTSTLVMKVIFPSDMTVRNVEFLEYAHAVDDYHWHRYTDDRTKISNDGGRQFITWTVKSPVVGGKYIIKWTFGGQA